MPPSITHASTRALPLAAALGLNLLVLVLMLIPSSSQAAGSVVLVNQTFKCSNYPQPIDFDLVKVTITAGQAERRDGFHTSGIGNECTGRIGRVEIDTWDADGIKVHPPAHDLVIEGGYVRCHDQQGDVHQDGIQAMGGTRVTFRNLEVDCASSEGVNSAMFINMGSGGQERPTDIVCDGCILKKAPTRNHVLRISDSVRSGARNSTIVWCGNGPSCGAGPAVYIIDAASDPVNENNTIVLQSGGTPPPPSPPPPPPPPPPPVNTALPGLSATAQIGATLTTSNGNWSNSPTGYTYEWRRCDATGANCSSIAGATSPNYVLAASDAGRTLRAVVTASNPAGSASATSNPSAVVVAAPPARNAPVNTALPALSGTAQVDATLTASTGSWSNSPTGYAHQWRRCDSAGANCASIAGATSANYSPVAADVGTTLRAVVTASNAGGSTAATSNASAVVVGSSAPPPPPPPAVPVNTALPTISGTARRGEVLNASTGSWSNSPSGYGHQWRRCDSVGTSCHLISGATAARYILGSDDIGRTLRVVVTASNASGSSSATSNATSVVADSPTPPPPPPPAAPVNTVLPTVSGGWQQGSLLRASNGNWSYAPTGYAFHWRRCDSAGANCASIGGATSSSYTLISADVGKRLRVVVTASNSGGSASATSPATPTVSPAPAPPPPPPVNIAPPAISGIEEKGKTLTASTGSWSNSPAGFTYKWRRCDSEGRACDVISGATSASYTLVAADVGRTLRVVVTAWNEEGFDNEKSQRTSVIAPAPAAPPVSRDVRVRP